MSQGVQSIFKMATVESRPRFVDLFAIPICGFLLILLCQIGFAYKSTVSGRHWHERLPIVWLEGLQTGSRSGKIYQAFFILLFLVIPAAALIHFMDKVRSLDVFKDDELLSQIHFFDWISPATIDGHQFALGNGIGADPAKVTFIPNVEPIFFSVLVIVALAHVVWLLISIFRQRVA